MPCHAVIGPDATSSPAAAVDGLPPVLLAVSDLDQLFEDPRRCRPVHINSDLIFGLFDLLALDFCPHLAGLPDRRLLPPGRNALRYGRRLAAWTTRLIVLR